MKKEQLIEIIRKLRDNEVLEWEEFEVVMDA